MLRRFPIESKGRRKKLREVCSLSFNRVHESPCSLSARLSKVFRFECIVVYSVLLAMQYTSFYQGFSSFLVALNIPVFSGL